MFLESGWTASGVRRRRSISPSPQPRRAARCPLCRRRSKRVHSRYTRTLADLPCGAAGVILHLHTRRFVCRVRWCRRAIFTERLPLLVEP